MSYKLDPELVPAMAALAAQAAEATSPARGDWQAVRAAASAGLAHLASITPPAPRPAPISASLYCRELGIGKPASNTDLGSHATGSVARAIRTT
jgi:hypothetical protein